MPTPISQLKREAIGPDLLEALKDAERELFEAEDKFWVIHCNHPGSYADGKLSNAQAQDKAFCAEMSDRMKRARIRVRAALSRVEGR